VHGRGLEPLCLATAEPKSAAYANFATRAGGASGACLQASRRGRKRLRDGPLGEPPYSPGGIYDRNRGAVVTRMNGRDFVVELERRGYVIKRRSRTYVWISRGEQVLMLDEEATVPEHFLINVLGPSRPPPSRRSGAPLRSSMRPGRTSTRPSQRP
jgi:hypothetical protein